jgi:hypothetical protein
MKKNIEQITQSTGLVRDYINAMVAYETVKSDQNLKYLEDAKKAYKEFLVSDD